MFGSGAGMSVGTIATTADIAAVATSTTASFTVRWTTTSAGTVPPISTAAWGSVLSAPFLTSRRAVAYSSTAHEGGKPKWAVLL